MHLASMDARAGAELRFRIIPRGTAARTLPYTLLPLALMLRDGALLGMKSVWDPLRFVLQTLSRARLTTSAEERTTVLPILRPSRAQCVHLTHGG